MIHGEDITNFTKNIKIKHGTILGIDYGEANTGLAISDINKIVSNPLTVVSTNVLLANLDSLIDQEQVVGIVIGLPKKLDGEGYHPLTLRILQLAKIINDHKNVDILLQDERMSSTGARAILKHGYGNSKIVNKNFKDDAHAANFVLQGTLDNINAKK